MKLLVNLARVDGKITDREKQYIINIGRANGIYPDQLEALFLIEHELILPSGLTPDQKFEFLYRLVELMKIDERMYQEEIRFCSTIATRLGYDQQVLFDLMLEIKSSQVSDGDYEKLKKLSFKFLKQ
jgi:hypothetical protein